MSEPSETEITVWAEIVYHLQGTCMSLDEALQQFDREDLADYMPFLQYLDGEIFCCTTCGWWYEQSEMAEGDHDEWICRGCEEDLEDA